MNPKLFVLAVLAASVLTGCKNAYRDDLHMICHSVELSGADPSTGIAGVAPYIAEHLKTKEAATLMASIAQSGGLDEFRAEAAANGVSPCPLFEARR